jgi:hypothetical protein
MASAADRPDASAFLKDEKPGEYDVTFRMEGTVYRTVKAESLEAAQREAERLLDDEDFGLELDQVDKGRVSHLTKTRPMYLVTRNGRKSQVSRLEPGDEPRQPDERGF